MSFWSMIFALTLTLTAKGEVGKILQRQGHGAQMIREGKLESIDSLKSLKTKDEILTRNSKLLISLAPSLQVSLSPNTVVSLVENSSQKIKNQLHTQVLIKIIKGSSRFLLPEGQQNVELKIETEAVTFTIQSADFELSLEDRTGIELDVFLGQVEASSPFVQSFVPEIIKAREGLRFDLKKKIFVKRNFRPRLKDSLKFQISEKPKSKK